jgi:hypothetical protein|tara:strand:+ start:2559 stop:2828 length:270 start_codon:yes stop_codon:yes gene_type:complete
MNVSELSYSRGVFANFFLSSLKIVKSDGHLRMYIRTVNQTSQYYIMNRGKITNAGKRKHIVAMWNKAQKANGRTDAASYMQRLLPYAQA